MFARRAGTRLDARLGGMFTRAIVRPPAVTFARGITTSTLGTPDVELARAQHGSYCTALERSGLSLIPLEPDPRFPDSTFIEDTAVLTDRVAILARPGAPSRQGEVALLAPTLAKCYEARISIRAPGTLDGGDVCQAGDHFFIGISARTNEAGAAQLAAILADHGYSATPLDIRDVPELLHLKSGLACVADDRLVLSPVLAGRAEFSGFETIVVDRAEAYAANCLRVNADVLVADGFPQIAEALTRLGHFVIPLEISEFRKMDGGLSCLSLRF